MSYSPPRTVVTGHVLVTPALAELEQSLPQPRPGEIVLLEGRAWRDRFIMTPHYGWLRLPD